LKLSKFLLFLPKSFLLLNNENVLNQRKKERQKERHSRKERIEIVCLELRGGKVSKKGERRNKKTSATKARNKRKQIAKRGNEREINFIPREGGVKRYEKKTDSLQEPIEQRREKEEKEIPSEQEQKIFLL